jgi:hypothetical protein
MVRGRYRLLRTRTLLLLCIVCSHTGANFSLKQSVKTYHHQSSPRARLSVNLRGWTFLCVWSSTHRVVVVSYCIWHVVQFNRKEQPHIGLPRNASTIYWRQNLRFLPGMSDLSRVKRMWHISMILDSLIGVIRL